MGLLIISLILNLLLKILKYPKENLDKLSNLCNLNKLY